MDEIKEKFEKHFGDHEKKESPAHELKEGESEKYPFEFVFEEEVGKHKRLL